ncbi:MAG: molybdopterin-dependent oxidoreductase [Chloroflexi bacterium]|nr:molybdopterin-dependent oxidoreductase [Chloroflexota bacterium]
MAERIVTTSCGHDCGGRCLLRVHLRDGEIIRIETDNEEEPQLRACLRGRAYRQRVYDPGRLKYPMRRVGARGEGRFERISWDEALDTVAGEMVRVRDTHGYASILYLGGGGYHGALHFGRAAERLLVRFGGFTRPWGDAGFHGVMFASMATYGTMTTGNAREDLLNSRLVIMWAWNPAVTIWDANTALTLARVREKGIRIVSVDPLLTESTAAFASEWVPIRPGTDTAMLIAMAYVIMERGLQDQAFLDRYTVGFERFRDYVTGAEDGVPKTPAWAEAITGVPRATIERLAVEYAASRPAALVPGWAPGRNLMGDQFNRAASTLAAMTGNVGKVGGYAGGFMRYFHSRELALPRAPGNPLEKGTPPRPTSLYKLRGADHPTSARIHCTKIYDAILQGKAAGYPCQPKLAYIEASDWLTAHPNVNKGIEAFKKLEFIVVHEQRLTPTARFADILLPVNSSMEREDVVAPWLSAPYYVYMHKTIDSLHESKADREICAELAPRLGISDYREGRTDAGWLEEIAKRVGDIPDFKKFREKGSAKIKPARPLVAFKEQIEDPAGHPFPTLSGKIEIYSEHIAEMKHPGVPPVAKYLPSAESPGSPLSRKYPLQMCSVHPKHGIHASTENLPWLSEVEPRRLWINSQDAQAHGIADGDRVMVFNDRGKALMKAWITERIMPGVVNIAEGGWFDIDEQGVDRGGCANTLIPDEPSPAGAWSAVSPLVQVIKISAAK